MSKPLMTWKKLQRLRFQHALHQFFFLEVLFWFTLNSLSSWSVWTGCILLRKAVRKRKSVLLFKTRFSSENRSGPSSLCGDHSWSFIPRLMFPFWSKKKVTRVPHMFHSISSDLSAAGLESHASGPSTYTNTLPRGSPQCGQVITSASTLIW